MQSYQGFMPGKRANMRKMIRYTAEYNFYYDVNSKLNSNFNQYYNPKNCVCIPDNYVKYVVGSDSPSIKVSNKQRIAQIVNYSKGGKSEYGNFYLGQPLNLNYLGRMEGMPGGSGKPPTNF
jgi:hypothetical protein